MLACVSGCGSPVDSVEENAEENHSKDCEDLAHNNANFDHSSPLKAPIPIAAQPLTFVNLAHSP